jgi:hypothetical protein
MQICTVIVAMMEEPEEFWSDFRTEKWTLMFMKETSADSTIARDRLALMAWI